MSDSLERIVPAELEADAATGRETLRLHLERYRFAARHLPPGIVMDLACGVGYGSVVLADAAGVRQVVGGDRSREALWTARTSYRHPRVCHVLGDGAAWTRVASFDGIVSLETLEHVDAPAGFFRDLVRRLRPGGVLVASVPTTPSVDANPHHRTDFTERSFLALGRREGLAVVDELRQVQHYSAAAVLLRRERRTRDLRKGLAGYYLRHPGAAFRRAGALLRYGFSNRYLTVAWRLPG